MWGVEFGSRVVVLKGAIEPLLNVLRVSCERRVNKSLSLQERQPLIFQLTAAKFEEECSVNSWVLFTPTTTPIG
jgi:hypothetical protein